MRSFHRSAHRFQNRPSTKKSTPIGSTWINKSSLYSTGRQNDSGSREGTPKFFCRIRKEVLHFVGRPWFLLLVEPLGGRGKGGKVPWSKASPTGGDLEKEGGGGIYPRGTGRCLKEKTGEGTLSSMESFFIPQSLEKGLNSFP